jgi:hypothetical protein
MTGADYAQVYGFLAWAIPAATVAFVLLVLVIHKKL